jgi:hypothetical protein
MTINIKGYEVLIDDILAPMILARQWCIADRKRGIYFCTSILFPDGRRHNVKLHRFIRETPPGMLIDHKNGNHLDCRLQNLRVCTTAQNTQNTPMSRNNKTGYRGVSFNSEKGKYRAVIVYNRHYINLGYFDTAKEAADVYAIKAKELFGEFYRETGAENCG